MKLNLGCGEHLVPGYTNVDLRLPADVLGDIRDLTFEDVTDVTAFHMLEHLPREDALPVLRRVRGWMAPRGRLTVEVPDMQAIMAAGCSGDWERYIYGAQDHAGEFHQNGFDTGSLTKLLRMAGWRNVTVRAFVSMLPQRPLFPCIEGRATA
jgi:predicted SAM-dependent methyltransferase